MTQRLNASLATVRVGGREYVYKTVPACRVCSAPDHRLAVEEATVAGTSWTKIAEGLPEGAGISSRSIREHFRRGHFPVVEAAVREHMDREAYKRGGEMESAVASVADHLGFAQSVVKRAQERLAAGDAEPSVREGLAASEFLARYTDVAAFTEADATEAFMIYHATVREVFEDEERLLEYGRRLAAHPTLQRMKQEYAARQAS